MRGGGGVERPWAARLVQDADAGPELGQPAPLLKARGAGKVDAEQEHVVPIHGGGHARGLRRPQRPHRRLGQGDGAAQLCSAMPTEFRRPFGDHRQVAPAGDLLQVLSGQKPLHVHAPEASGGIGPVPGSAGRSGRNLDPEVGRPGDGADVGGAEAGEREAVGDGSVLVQVGEQRILVFGVDAAAGVEI